MSSRLRKHPLTKETDPAPTLVGRLTRLSIAVIAALAIAVVVSALGGSGAEAPGGRLGGDLPAFFGAGEIVVDGDWDELYEPTRQIAAQAELWETEGEYLYFAYPPFVAGAYATLIPLGYRLGYVVHTFAMALALLGAVLLIRPVFGWLREWPVVVPYAVALSFYPMLRAVLGGQNSALTLLVAAAAVRLETDDRAAAAGLVLALALYKPQFGVPLALLLIAGRRWRMLAGWTAGAVVLFAAAALTSGMGWIGDWWDQASSFRELNAATNGKNFISLPGVLDQAFGIGSDHVIVLILTALVGLGAAALWWRLPRAPAMRMAVALSVIVLIAPQALFYEAGVLLLPLAVLGAAYPEMRLTILGTGWLAGLLHLVPVAGDVSALALFVVTIAVATVVLAVRAASRRVPSV